MELAIRTGKNLFYKITGELATRILAFLFYAIIARKLGTADFGKNSFAYSFTIICALLVDMGFNSILIRDISQHKHNIAKYVGNISFAKLISSVVSFFIVLFAGYLTGYYKNYGRAILLMAVVSILSGWIDYIIAIFNAFEKMNYEALLKFCNRAFLLIFGVAALLLNGGLYGLLEAMIFASVISVVFGLFMVRIKITPFKLNNDIFFIKKIFIIALPVFLSTLFMSAYHNIGTILMPAMGCSDIQIGWFSPGIKLIEITALLPVLFVSASFPVLSDFFGRSENLFADSCRYIVKFLFVAGLPIAILGVLFSKEIVLFIFGSQYLPTGVIFSILLWSVPLVFVNHALMQIFIINHNQKITTYTAISAFLINFILNILLIPKFGYIGASISFVITETVLFLENMVLSSYYKVAIDWGSWIWKIIIVAVVSAAIIYGLPISLVVKIMLLFIVNMAGFWFLRILTDKDISFIKNILVNIKMRAA
ncbi:MAG: flippase [Elusimicrobiota bacterium]